MEELCKKYPALVLPYAYIDFAQQVMARYKNINCNKDELYKDFKSNISCIGLEPEEYDQVIKWFCDTMGY